tara:strand:- start:13810 stop:14877 length:1068 start_codon:yes stop_codon:yes gene_type:complete
MLFNRIIFYVLGISILILIGGCASPELTTARLAIREEDWDKAESALLAAAKVEPENAEIFYLLGKEIYARNSQWDKMNEMFGEAMRVGAGNKLSTGKTVDESISDSKNLYWSELYNKGADKYNKAINSEGDEKYKFLAEAISLFESAIQANPDEARTYNNLFHSYLFAGNEDKVSAKLDEALERHPDNVEILIHASKISKDNGDLGRTVEILEKAYRLDNQNMLIITMLAEAYYDTGDKEGAIFAFTKAIRNDPENTDLYYNLGVLYLQIGDYDFAEEEFRKAIDLNPEDAEAIMGMGEAYERLERWDDAENFYLSALEIDMGNPGLLRALSRVVLRQERMEESTDYLQRAKQFE